MKAFSCWSGCARFEVITVAQFMQCLHVCTNFLENGIADQKLKSIWNSNTKQLGDLFQKKEVSGT